MDIKDIDKEKVFSVLDRLLEPSTIKGVVALLGAVLIFFFKPEDANNWVTNISNLLFALYGVYQIFRNESAQIAKAAEKLKAAGILSLTLLLIPLVVNAEPFLCVEPAPDADVYELVVDGTSIGDLPYQEFTVDTILWHCIYDLGATGLSSGDHTFESRAIHSSGMPGDWAVPLNTKKPGKSNNWLIKR